MKPTNEMQGIIRVENRKKYTKIDDRLLKDTRLSLETSGLLTRILSNRDDWHVSVAYIVKYWGKGRYATKRMIKEAIELGYLWMSNEDLRNDKGQFCGKQYVLYEHWSDNPHFKPETVEPEAVEPEIIKESEVEEPELVEDYEEFEEPELVEEPEAIEEPELVFNGGTKNYSNAKKDEIKRLLADCPQAQDILDEVGYQIQQGKVRNPMGLLTHLKQLALKGEFVPTHQFKRQRGVSKTSDCHAYKPFVSSGSKPLTPEERERRRKVAQDARRELRGISP